MRINVHAGHNFKVPGASGIFSETSEDRKVKDLVIRKLQAAGHTVYDCTDESSGTVNGNLAAIVANCNAHAVDLSLYRPWTASFWYYQMEYSRTLHCL